MLQDVVDRIYKINIGNYWQPCKARELFVERKNGIKIM